jgi:hypothetical protein
MQELPHLVLARKQLHIEAGTPIDGILRNRDALNRIQTIQKFPVSFRPSCSIETNQ